MKENKKPSVPALLASTAIGALAAGGGYLLGKSALTDPAVKVWFHGAGQALTGWDLLMVPVLVLIVLGTHELGHVLGGLSRGMRFLLLIFGPFQWHASASGLRFQWVTRLGLMGGVAATVPTEVGPGLRRQLIPMIAGGPAASLILALAAVALAIGTEGRFAAYGVFVAVTSLGIFLVTIIPLRTAGFMSDGMQLVDVLRGGRSVIERTTLLQVSAESLSGIRPRDWSSSAVDGLTALESSEPLRRIASWLMLLYRAMDCRQPALVEQYRALLTQHLDDYPDGFRQSIHVELAVCAALNGDKDGARHHLALGKGGVVEKSRRLLAQSALAALEGREAESVKLAQLATQSLPGALDSGLARLTAEQLESLRKEQTKWSG